MINDTDSWWLPERQATLEVSVAALLSALLVWDALMLEPWAGFSAMGIAVAWASSRGLTVVLVGLIVHDHVRDGTSA